MDKDGLTEQDKKMFRHIEMCQALLNQAEDTYLAKNYIRSMISLDALKSVCDTMMDFCEDGALADHKVAVVAS